MASAADVAWFCWNLGRRLYAIESALPIQIMPGDFGPQDLDVTALSRWIGSLMTLLIHHARYLDPTRPFPPGWPAPNECPAWDAPPYFPARTPT